MPYRGFFRDHSILSIALYSGMDFCAIGLGALSAHLVRFDAFALSPHYRAPAIITLVLALAIFPRFGLYDSWRGRSAFEHIRAMTFAWISTMLALILVGFILKESGEYSRGWVLGLGAFSWVFLCAGRLSAGASLRWLRRRGFNQRRILLVGTGDTAQRVAERVCGQPSSGWVVIGAAPVEENPPKELQTVRVLRAHRRLERLVRRVDADEIWICLPLDEQRLIEKAVWEFRHCTATIRLIPSLRSMNLIRHPVDEVLGVPMLNLSMSPMHGLNRLVKAVEDRVFAGLLLLVTSPLMLAVAATIRLTSPGPVLFRQKRHGSDGRIFEVLKFRSMTVGAGNNRNVPQAKRDDPRVTPIGRFLRRTSLDELPQLFNVLKGDMSIVGPRPHAVQHNEEYKEKIDAYMQRHKVKPGITGWAQVNGWRGETDTLEKMQKRVEFDLYYIENWSLWFDIKIILMTIFKGFVHENAY